jgi:hypothetical protein
VSRRKPPRRVTPARSRDNEKRQIRSKEPSHDAREELAASASYGCYSKHKYHPSAYRLSPYAGADEERTFCDEHAHFGPGDFARIPRLLRRGIMAGLWGEYSSHDAPAFYGQSMITAGYMSCVSQMPDCLSIMATPFFPPMLSRRK